MTLTRIARALMPLVWTVFFWLPAMVLTWWAIESIYGVPIRPESFRFERAWAALLAPAALLVLFARGYLQPRAAPRLLVSRGKDLAAGRSGLRTWLAHAPTGMRVVAVLLVVAALMGPQSIHARDRSEVSGIDIMLTLDASLSMNAADVVPNRFEATKVVVNDFISRRPNDRIGAVIFGREAYTLMPLTTDEDSLRTVISELELGLIDGRGTAIGNAVATSLNRLRRSTAKSRVIILLTDGDSNSGNVSPDQAAEFAAVMQVKVYSVLMGVSDDARVQRGVGLGGRPLFDVGSFPVNPELLRSMSARTGGEFFPVSDRQALERLFHAILDHLERSEIEDLGVTYGELFPVFVWPAFALVALELFASALLLRRWP